MTSVLVTITMSLDGYITGPNDGPGRGLGEGGERLHYWVFGGPWTYDTEKLGAATGKDKEHLDRMMSSGGAVVGGRGTYDAADAWGGTNPWPVPFFIVTHHPEDEPAGKGFTFVNGVEEAILRAREAAGGKNVDIMGGADVIRQALRAGHSTRSGSPSLPSCLAAASASSKDSMSLSTSSPSMRRSRSSRRTSGTACSGAGSDLEKGMAR